MIIKGNSGPGRLNQTLLARLINLSVIMYLGVLNMTAITQETNRNYGPLKTQFRANLDIMVWERITKKVSVSMQPWLANLVIFGGTDPDTVQLDFFCEIYGVHTMSWSKLDRF